MFDPLAMFCGGEMNAEGMMMIEEEERKEKIEEICGYLHMNRYANLKDACDLYKIPLRTITKKEKDYIKKQAPWIS